MSDAHTKSARLEAIKKRLLAHPRGLTQAELARDLGVHRSTIFRSLPDLGEAVYEEGGRLYIDREAYLVEVRLSLHEALAIHLAGRLLAARLDRKNPHAASALRKLALSLERLAPRISLHLEQSAGVMDETARREDPLYLQVLEKLTLAWAEQKKTRIWYRKPNGEVSENIFCPYFIEPGAVGMSTYVIGRREPDDVMRTFKIERIERIDLLRENYTIPDDFDPRVLLANAWGIWFTESDPVDVALRFSPHAAGRVKETCWHASERIEELPGGGLLWRACVAEPQEMLPWIRGWGADVEVLEPGWLREELARHAIAMAEMYQDTSAAINE